MLLAFIDTYTNYCSEINTDVKLCDRDRYPEGINSFLASCDFCKQFGPSSRPNCDVQNCICGHLFTQIMRSSMIDALSLIYTTHLEACNPFL